MYYYLDDDQNFHGPYSANAFRTWWNKNYFKSGIFLYDEDKNCFLIEDVIKAPKKARPKKTSSEDPAFNDQTYDVSISNVNQAVNQSSVLEKSVSSVGVEEVGLGSCSDSLFTCLQQLVGTYLDHRPLNNKKSKFVDNYVPFQYSWKPWVPFPLTENYALRSVASFNYQVRGLDPRRFSAYLKSLGITLKNCTICQLTFKNSYEMFVHFLSVPHVNRMYKKDSDDTLSHIDIFCAEKMLDDYNSLEKNGGILKLPSMKPSSQQDSVFKGVEEDGAFEIFMSLVKLMKTPPLLNPLYNQNDKCEKIEAVMFFRNIEYSFQHIKSDLNDSRIGDRQTTTCGYCNIDIDSLTLGQYMQHILSQQHIYNVLDDGISRAELEYLVGFLAALKNSPSLPLPMGISIQEQDFPLCCDVVNYGEKIVYDVHEFCQIVAFLREKIHVSYSMLDDIQYRTTCRWCTSKIYSLNGILCHILYEPKHLVMKTVSNDEIRRLLRHLKIPVSMPLFRDSNESSKMIFAKKKKLIQKMQSLVEQALRRHSLDTIVKANIPMGLVNQCELCDMRLSNYQEVVFHVISENHIKKITHSDKVHESDIQLWINYFQKI